MKDGITRAVNGLRPLLVNNEWTYSGLQDRLAFRTCPNVDGLRHFGDEYLTVAMVPGMRALPDRLNDPLHFFITANNLDFRLLRAA